MPAAGSDVAGRSVASGVTGEVGAEADDRRPRAALQQDTCDLNSVEQDVVRPFEAEPFWCDPAIERAGERHGGDERQLLRRPFAGLRPGQDAGEQVARHRHPRPPTPPASTGLGVGTDPAAVSEVGLCREPVVCRPDGGEVDQIRLAAARAAAATSGVIASIPSGEQNSAAAVSSTVLVRLSAGAKAGAGSSK